MTAIINIRLNDNSEHALPISFMNLTNKFRENETNILNINQDIFNKIREFGNFYLSLEHKKEKDMFKNPKLIFNIKSENNESNIKNWCNNFLDMNIDKLLALMNESQELDIKELLNICCYKLSNIINNKSIDEIKNMLNITSNLSTEEIYSIRSENSWI